MILLSKSFLAISLSAEACGKSLLIRYFRFWRLSQTKTVSLDDVVSSFPVHVEWDLVDYPTVKIYTSFGIHLDNQIFTCLEKLFSNSSSVGKKETRQASESIMIDIWDAKAEQVTYQHHRHWSNRENLIVAYGIRDRRFHTTPSTNTKAPFTINNVPYGLKLVV
jgi:hypothetical protein